jgi:hypothetical protein
MTESSDNLGAQVRGLNERANDSGQFAFRNSQSPIHARLDNLGIRS